MCNRPLDFDGIELPQTLVRDIMIDAVFETGGKTQRKNVAQIRDNYQQLVKAVFDEPLSAVKEIIIIPEKTTGKTEEKYENYAHIFSVDILI